MTDLALGVTPVKPVPTLRDRSALPGRRTIVALLVVIGLILGFGVAYLAFREPTGPSNFDGAPSITEFDLPAPLPTAGAADATIPTPVVVSEPATPRAALEQFLNAEIARTPDASFALLDGPTRQTNGTVAAWQSTRANRLLPEQFTVIGEKSTPVGTDLTISATRTPAVTTVTGLVPAKSEETWRVVKDGGWRVVGGRATDVRPILPSDALATSAAAAWLEKVASCDAEGALPLQLSANLSGAPGFRDVPCKAKGTWTAGKAFPVSELVNSTVFVSAYGSSVGRWARAVPAVGNGRFTIVLAPLGDEWRVMGLVPQGTSSP